MKQLSFYRFPTRVPDGHVDDGGRTRARALEHFRASGAELLGWTVAVRD